MPLHAYETTTPSRQYQSSPFTRHSPRKGAKAGSLSLQKPSFGLRQVIYFKPKPCLGSKRVFFLQCNRKGNPKPCFKVHGAARLFFIFYCHCSRGRTSQHSGVIFHFQKTTYENCINHPFHPPLLQPCFVCGCASSRAAPRHKHSGRKQCTQWPR